MGEDGCETMASTSDTPSEKRDFANLRKSGERPGTSWAIGHVFCAGRDQLARLLVWLGVTPNAITATGFLLTVCAGVCLAIGGGHTFGKVEGLTSSRWCFVAFWLLLAAGPCDMLDGAVSRIGGIGTRFGQVLDSTLDRFSDGVLYLGLIVHFAWVGNVTLCALSGIAMVHAYAISYVKARSENLLDSVPVGWWQRPERCFGFLTGTLFGHMPALIWQQATLPFFTVLLRLRYAGAALKAQERGTDPPKDGPLPGIGRYLAPWRHARGSLPYDVMAAINIGWIIVAPWIWPFFYGRTDPLRTLMERWFG